MTYVIAAAAWFAFGYWIGRISELANTGSQRAWVAPFRDLMRFIGGNL